ncbi:tetratricopeptide repeat-containing diguanylate cyclase [Pleionea sediminis]|uniref:tetratricopeptide repeat-containing diguanylate cyclase n=1 Tax=Pleionea sediminis TaxID=2569479 RepID=UPI001185B382|nr:diguanylate cyclase [Pleionea sediminis]
MRRFLHIPLLLHVIIIMVYLSASAFAQETSVIDEERSKAYQLSLEFLDTWDDAFMRSNENPNAVLEELDTKIKGIPDNEVKKRAYAQLTEIQVLVNLEKSPEALDKLNKIKPLITKLPDSFNSRFLGIRANIHLNMGELEQGLIAINQSINILKNEDLPIELAEAQFIRGQIYYAKHEHNNALADYQLAYKIFKEFDYPIQLGTVISSIAQLYSRTNDHVKAIEYYKESLELIDVAHQKLYASIIYYNVGTAYTRIKQFIEAEEYFKKALDLSEQLGDLAGQAYAWRELGKIAEMEDNHELSIEYHLKALEVMSEHKDRRMLVSLHIGLAESYLALEQFESALEQIDKAIKIAKFFNVPEGLLKSYKVAAVIHEGLENYSEAIGFYKEQIELIRKQQEAENQESLNMLKVKFATEKKEAENTLLEKENAIKQLKIEKQAAQQRVLWLFITLAVIIVLAGIIILKRQILIRKRFTRLALTDELTQAPNRRHILEYAKDQLAWSRETDSNLIIALIDLDKFKLINDVYGHEVGDEVLKYFYREAKGVLRRVDQLGRIGGEEWLLVMPGSQLSQIDAIFDRLKQAVYDCNVKGLPKEYHLTFSMGVTLCDKESNWESILKRADRAVYQAKRNGRDRWEMIEK